jgi:hypothetical protein
MWPSWGWSHEGDLKLRPITSALAWGRRDVFVQQCLTKKLTSSFSMARAGNNTGCLHFCCEMTNPFCKERLTPNRGGKWGLAITVSTCSGVMTEESSDMKAVWERMLASWTFCCLNVSRTIKITKLLPCHMVAFLGEPLITYIYGNMWFLFVCLFFKL